MHKNMQHPRLLYPRSLRAQILKIFKILKFSSEIEIFKRATHQPPIFCGENFKRDWNFNLVWKFSSEIDNFKRDWFFSIFRPLGVAAAATFCRRIFRGQWPLSCDLANCWRHSWKDTKEYLNQRGTKIRVIRLPFRAPFLPDFFQDLGP